MDRITIVLTEELCSLSSIVSEMSRLKVIEVRFGNGIE